MPKSEEKDLLPLKQVIFTDLELFLFLAYVFVEFIHCGKVVDLVMDHDRCAIVLNCFQSLKAFIF